MCSYFIKTNMKKIFPHLVNEETEAQGAEITSSRAQSW
jgi:hypothetical protein